MIKLSQIVGQDAAVKALCSALPPGSPGAGYLFAGPEGVGKMTCAMAWAQSLFCQSPRGHDACGRCGPCLKTESGNNPDLLILRPAVREKKVKEEIDIDSVRGLIERLGFKPYESSRKVAIIDGADSMNAPAANAFLKTLEEPPGDTALFLIAANLGKLPATIISRCRIVRFTPVPRETLERYLVESKGLEPKMARTVAALCRGSIGAAGAGRQKEEMELRASALDFIAKARSAPAANYHKMARAMDKAKERETVDRFLAMVYSLLREMAVMKFTGKCDNLVNVDIAGELETAAREYTGRRILGVAAAVESLMAARSLHINPFLTVSLLYWRLRKDS